MQTEYIKIVLQDLKATYKEWEENWTLEGNVSISEIAMLGAIIKATEEKLKEDGKA